MVKTPSLTSTSTSFSSIPGRGHTSLGVGRIHLDGRPSPAGPARYAPEGRRHPIVKAVEDVVKEAVHFAVQRQEGTELLAVLHGVWNRGTTAAPWDQVSDCHSHIL